MVSFTKLYWISDISAAVLGVILNSTLLFSIFKTTKAKINPYTYLVLIPCINDLIVSGYALLLQHVSELLYPTQNRIYFIIIFLCFLGNQGR